MVWVYAALVVALALSGRWGLLALTAGYIAAGWWGVILVFAVISHGWDVAEKVTLESKGAEHNDEHRA